MSEQNNRHEFAPSSIARREFSALIWNTTTPCPYAAKDVVPGTYRAGLFRIIGGQQFIPLDTLKFETYQSLISHPEATTDVYSITFIAASKQIGRASYGFDTATGAEEVYYELLGAEIYTGNDFKLAETADIAKRLFENGQLVALE